MEKLFSILDDLEQACGDEDALRRFTRPDVGAAIAAIRALAPEDRARIHGQLDRVRVIMEGNLLLYGARVEQLRCRLQAAQAGNKATGKYRRVAAIIPVIPAHGAPGREQ